MGWEAHINLDTLCRPALTFWDRAFMCVFRRRVVANVCISFVGRVRQTAAETGVCSGERRTVLCRYLNESPSAPISIKTVQIWPNYI